MKERTAELDYNKESQRKLRKASDICVFLLICKIYFYYFEYICIYICKYQTNSAHEDFSLIYR